AELVAMAWYRAEEVFDFLFEQNCAFESRVIETAMQWYASDGMPFVLPHPQEGWFEAEIVDDILSDHCIWACKRTRHIR
ncbi:MAG TPA: hypothetical protein VFO36_13735, partial [Nitrospiraceae bacterium]|nr:hypothetical protein [Nitrospiraceae bacterium]